MNVNYAGNGKRRVLLQERIGVIFQLKQKNGSGLMNMKLIQVKGKKIMDQLENDFNVKERLNFVHQLKILTYWKKE